MMKHKNRENENITLTNLIFYYQKAICSTWFVSKTRKRRIKIKIKKNVIR
jgi:hypothetical protein